MRTLALAAALAAALALPVAGRAAAPMALKFASPGPPVGAIYRGLSGFSAARLKAKVQPSIAAWVKSTPDGAHVLAAFRSEVAKLSAK